MPKQKDVFEVLTMRFERALVRLIEGRLRRWRSVLHGGSARRSQRQISPAFQKFKRGEITLEEFLEIKIERSVTRLQKFLDPDEMEFLREHLRQRFREDPVFVDLVTQIASYQEPSTEVTVEPQTSS